MLPEANGMKAEECTTIMRIGNHIAQIQVMLVGCQETSF